jgi:hypothetical protein
MFITKSDKVREYVKNSTYKNALFIAKGFRLGITRDNIDAMRLAYECLVNERFYKQLNVDTEAAIKNGINVLKQLYAQ